MLVMGQLERKKENKITTKQQKQWANKSTFYEAINNTNECNRITLRLSEKTY